MLESLESMEAFPRGEDDAYRLYDVGVAYEALGYQAEDPKTAARFLDEAAINYGKALDARPSEANFAEPQRRIEMALAHFKKIQSQPAPVSQAPDEALPLEVPQVLVHGGERRQREVLPDLLQGGCIAVLGDERLQVVEHLLLPLGDHPGAFSTGKAPA